MKLLLLSIGILLVSCNQNNKAEITPTSTEHASTPDPIASIIHLPWKDQKQLPIWTTAIPDSGLIKGIETYNDGMVKNVSIPTITIYSPKGKNTGAAVIIFPGGGYNKLAIELEGSEICEWYASIGITGILLKYRVPGSGPHYEDSCHCEKDPLKPMALQDAQRTVGLVRSKAKEWNIDPQKIGVMGFSAGGHLVADISAHFKQRAYALTDDIDKISCRPDFGISFFPGHMTFHTTRPYQMNPDIVLDKTAPPTFILQAGNDPVDTIQNSLLYYIALKKAGVLAEYHVYAEGGHAFGLKKNSQKDPEWPKLPIADWPELVQTFLHTIKMLEN